MKLNTSKMMFIYVIFMTTLISLSSNNWLTIWIMMETALFMLIPLMSKNKINDQSMKYFIIQSTSSYILIFSILWNSLNETNLNSLMTLISLMIKIGMPPFHTWKPMMMSNLGWTECLILSTLIKIPPMVLINSLIDLKMLILPLTMTLMVGSISGINQLNLKKLMAYSSIFNLTWMTSSFLLSKKISLTFMIIYSMLNLKTMFFFKLNNLIYTNQMMHMPLKMKLVMNLNLLSISGLPPLSGFFPKWIILNELIKNSIILPSIMVITSVISMFVYIQINSFSFSNFYVKKKNNKIFWMKNLSAINLIILIAVINLWVY
uniref:NADH-ubiquinone oxidoreductase chain 2 n=1 Tax=Laodelphax striatellus TaxID=195883 RepID=A0A4Y5UPF5_LAOST|nr:NADH dehydrogenase subunit 2 [Laodelphax striatellus]